MLKEKKINNILITGAGGFIGGNLSNFLSSRYNIFGQKARFSDKIQIIIYSDGSVSKLISTN